MILDGQNTFSDVSTGDALSGATVTVDFPSANVIDQGVGSFRGEGGAYEAPFAIYQAATALTGSADTIQAVLQHSVDNSTWVDLDAGVAFNPSGGSAPAAAIGAYLYASRIPQAANRYLRFVTRTTGSSQPSGTVIAFLTLDQDVVDFALRKATGQFSAPTPLLSTAVSNSVELS